MAVTIAQVKEALQTILVATEEFGSIHTEVPDRFDDADPAAVAMHHDGGSQELGPDAKIERTVRLQLIVVVPRGPSGDDEDMQRRCDQKLEALLKAIQDNRTLNTGSGHLVWSALPVSWDITYDEQEHYMVAEVIVLVTYEA